MHDQDRELQIRLAKLQADVQFYSACAFGFLAGYLSVIILGVQIFFSLPIETRSMFEVVLFFLVALIACILFCALFSAYYMFKANRARNEIEELKRKYCW